MSKDRPLKMHDTNNSTARDSQSTYVAVKDAIEREALLGVAQGQLRYMRVLHTHPPTLVVIVVWVRVCVGMCKCVCEALVGRGQAPACSQPVHALTTVVLIYLCSTTHLHGRDAEAGPALLGAACVCTFVDRGHEGL
jgi:hypothetical protein